MESNLISVYIQVIVSLLLATCIHCQALERTSVVQTESGPVQGNIQKTIFYGFNYSSFKAISYAKAPIGLLRFKPPVPADPWTEVFDATEEGPTCPQYDMIFEKNTYMGDEDCLNLNVYTPLLDFNSTVKYPVMVWIYGGAFVEGYKNQSLYGPDLWMEEGVVVVVPNYRLGVLGFLNLGISGAHGNAGMMDQVLALKWVQANIAKFGGDPNNVTLFGESAGSSSVALHELSPQSRGLFHKSFGQSGAPLILLSQSQSTALASAYTLGTMLGFDPLNMDRQQLLEFFYKIDAKELVMKTTHMFVFADLIMRPFQPSPEDPTVADPADIFLSECPITLMMEGKIHKGPKMIGYNTNEFYGFVEVTGLVPILELIIPYNLMVAMANIITQVLSQIIMVADVELTQRFYAAHNDDYPVYYNELVYKDFQRHIITSLPVISTTHADDLGLTFTSDKYGFTNSTDPNYPLNVLRRKLVQLCVNFARESNPTPASNNPIEVTWEPSGSTGRQLIIDTVFKMTNRASSYFDFLIQSIYYFLLPLCSSCHKVSYATPYTDLFTVDMPNVSTLTNVLMSPPNVTSLVNLITPSAPTTVLNSLI